MKEYVETATGEDANGVAARADPFSCNDSADIGSDVLPGAVHGRGGDRIKPFSIDHTRYSGSSPAGHLLWQCTICGDVGHIDDHPPETCQKCVDQEETVMWWTEE